MRKCCVKQCVKRIARNQQKITIHRFPTNEKRRNEWINLIGKENLDMSQKVLTICSLHFKESSFNRTMTITRLRDDAVPFQDLVPKSRPLGYNALIDLDLESGLGTSSNILKENKSLNINAASIREVGDMPIVKLKKQCASQKNKIKRLNENVRRLKKKVTDYKVIITDLNKRSLVNTDCTTVLEDLAGPKDFLKYQISKSRGLPLPKQYSEEIRKFALTLHFYSPKAYNYVRRIYNTCLPHPRTLVKWYQHLNAEPGFCEEAFKTLEKKVSASDWPVVCALTFDEMAIRKSLSWDPQSNKYYGRVNVGIECDSDSLELASQCLVMLLTCINGPWKLPVGYFLITSLSGEQKASLLQMCIKKCINVGVKIVSVTCDGPATNFSMFNLMGCNFTDNISFFKCGEDDIQVFIDPCHCIKLIRNAFGEIKVFYDHLGRKIDFRYLEKLNNLQEVEELHLATKLKKTHIFFGKQKMKVRLATQLLSDSVADALDFCENELKLRDFQGCAATSSFIRLFNNIFDILNSHSMRPPGWKKAICPENVGLVTSLFESGIGYIKSLKLASGQLILESRRKTGFLGFIIAMQSALRLYEYLVHKSKILKYLPLYKLSQDHVELFFSAVRARGGYNNNPNAVQFRAAFKRLLIRAEIRDGGVGNCIPLEQINILTCSSKADPICTINDLTAKNKFVEVSEEDSDVYEEFISSLNNTQSQYSESVVTYIAGFVARKLSRKINCDICIFLLLGDKPENKGSLVTQKTRGGLTHPSNELENLIKKVEKILKCCFKKTEPENYYLYIFNFFIDYFNDSEVIFESDDKEHDTNHKYLLIKSVIKTYMDISFRYFGKICCQRNSLRNYLNKIILFRNE